MKTSRINLLIAVMMCMAVTQAYAQKSYIVKGATKRIAKEIAEESGERIAKKSIRTFRNNYIENAVTEQSLKKIAREKVYQKLKAEGIKSFLEYGNKKAVAKTSHTGLSIAKNKYAQSFKKLGYKERLALSRKKGGTAVAEDVASKNAKLLKRYASRSGLTLEKQAKLLQEMNADEGLANLIRENPEFNIKRWLNTRNHVDQNKIIRNSKGGLPVNARIYSGNTFYFDPNLNTALRKKLEKEGTYNGYTYKELMELDRLYPNGIPWTKEGFPDFIKANACYLKKDGTPLIITQPNGFTGNRDKDFNIARKILKGNGIEINEYGYIWHHLEGKPDRMVLVKTECHEIAKHSGGHSLNL